MLIGYARVSTEDQHLDLQRDALARPEVRHKTGRIAWFVARTRNKGAQLPVPVELGSPNHLQHIEIAKGYFDPNRVQFNRDGD